MVEQSRGSRSLSDREALLTESASIVDSLGQPLGAATPGATEHGDFLRDLSQDEVGLANDPMFFRLSEEAFSGQGLPVPVAYEEATRQHRLYWLCAPVSLFPARHWGFNALDVRLEFNSESPAGVRRPVAFAVLPDPEVESVLDIGGAVNVSIDPALNFKATTPDIDLEALGIPLAASAGLEVSAVANAHAAIGPFRYTLTRAVISHTPVGMEFVRWRIDEAASLEGKGPSLVVLLAVPLEAEIVIIDAQMEARRYFKFASAPLQEKIRQLPARLREFFMRDGAPVPYQTTWNVTSLL